MILRIAVSDPTATCQLNLKFGADPLKAAPQLLVSAKELGVNVVGIRQARQPSAHEGFSGAPQTMLISAFTWDRDATILWHSVRPSAMRDT